MSPEEAPPASSATAWRAVTLIGIFVLLVAVGGFAISAGGNDQLTAQPATATSTTEAPPETTTTAEPTTTTTAPPTTTTTVDPVSAPTVPVLPVGPVDGAAPSISRVATTDPVIFVTIDDGMVADPRVLDYLTTTRMPVTMFLNDAPARANRDFFEALRQLGNSVNSHTLTHPNLRKLSVENQRSQICGMVDVLNELFGTDGGFFRAPFGELPASARQQAATCGIRAALQWKGTLNNGVLALQEETLKPGDIILAHFTNTLYEDLVEIKRQADAAGLRIARVEDYLPAG
jgi:peptidoglycan/xylan/chitin deacetylase (PgdA/CDA1 family)